MNAASLSWMAFATAFRVPLIFSPMMIILYPLTHFEALVCMRVIFKN
jgi:hypothetical protein